MGLFDVIERAHSVQAEHRDLHPLLTEFLYEPKVTKIPGPDDWIGASATGDWCPRWHVMAWRLGHREAERNLAAQDRWVIDRGTAFHRVFQELWMGPMGWIYGGWRCPSCGHLHTKHSEPGKPELLIDGWKSPVTPLNSVVMPERCETCDHKSSKFDPFRFEEPWCRSEAEKVRGPCDGLLMLPAHSLEVFDLKTTGSLRWVRKEPRYKDKVQVHWYMDAYNIRTGRIVYVDVSQRYFDDAVVEHVFPFDSDLMTREKRKIRACREAIENPSRPVPACPYGGKLPYGDCKCVDLAVQWASAGSRSSPEGDRRMLADALGLGAASPDDRDADRRKGEPGPAD